MRVHILIASLLLLGCSSSGNTITQDLPDGSGSADQRGLTDLLPDAERSPDALPELVDFDQVGDDAPDLFEPACEPGEGCFLDKCAENGDCLSGWCVEHLGEGVCSQMCQAECPPGWECQQVAGTEPDVIYICVSNHANLCRPCTNGADCKSVGGAEDVCVDYGDAGSFCGGTCSVDDDCPWGFSCIGALTVDGIETKQCVADAGECPCTEKSVALSLWTPCVVDNEFGTCAGKRICGDGGLSDCDAPTPAEEICNGLDDDCDGETDEATCDDGNECTQDACLGEDGCQNVALEQGECKDDNPCTVADHCEAGVCIGDPVLCDDQNPCTDDICTEQGGCDHLPAAGNCDDGEVCTLGDHCSDGECLGEPVNCDCESDSDCAALEDGDFCNGTLYCDLTEVPYKCRVKADSVVSCPPAEGPDAPCLAPLCNPANGTCSLAPANGGKPCDDGDLCTLGDACFDGECTPGAPANCNDGNPCTDDSCDPDQGCLHADNQAPCSDGDVCTVADACVGGTCISGQPLDCDDANPCTDDSCDADSGCLHAANSAQCDDGNACTTNDLCANGSCKAGSDVNCDDDNPCTGDSCSAALGCVHTMLTTACDDGDSCTGPDLCQQGECIGEPLICNDGNPCTDDACVEGIGCVYTNNADACDDGNECTLNDLCAAGTCKGGPLLNCDDDNVCTTDTCSPAQGCIYTFNTAPCTDDNVCTLKDQCSLGECVGSGSLACNDANPCTDDTCKADIGCQFVANQVPCDDGNACTDSDVCAAGICTPGDAVNCNDDNICTDDSCAPAIGCQHVNNTVPCSDSNACTLDDVCSDGECVGGPALDCNDDNLCTNDACDSLDGCVYQFNAEPCDDEDPCTVTDACANGSCKGSGELDCNDDVACTADSCETGVGCQHVVTVDYQNDDNNCGSCGNVCAQDQECSAGNCVLSNPWVGAAATWTSAGKAYGRFTWAQAGVSNNGRANAMSFCTGKGGTLARPNSQDEWDKIYANMPASGYGWWMDGHNNFTCGTISGGGTKSYQYGLMYCPSLIGSMYTGCNCTASEQGLVLYRATSPGHFDGCQTGSFGAMDEHVSYDHSAIQGFICEKN